MVVTAKSMFWSLQPNKGSLINKLENVLVLPLHTLRKQQVAANDL